VEDHASFIYFDVIVEFLQLFSGCKDFANSKNGHTCAGKGYSQPEKVCYCFPSALIPYIVLVKRVIIDVSRERGHTPNPHCQYDKGVDKNARPVN
jgi:hypothetical protein